MNNKVNYGLCVLLLTVLCLAVGLPMAAAEDHIQLKQLRPPAEFEAEEEVDRVIRHKFDMVGKIDHIPPEEDRIVVYDMSFNLAPGVSISGLKVGMYVGMKLDEDRKVVLIERIPKPERKVE